MNTLVSQDQENELVKKAQELMDDFHAIAQGKSNFVLQNFVVNQHDTGPARRKQALLELQIRMFGIQRNQILARRFEAQRAEKIGELDFLTQQDSPVARARAIIKQTEIDEIELNLKEFELTRLGQLREAEALYQIIQQYPKLTREEYEADEVQYWTLRLARQTMLSLRDVGHPGQGNLDAIRMMEEVDAPWLKVLAGPINTAGEIVHALQASFNQSQGKEVPCVPNPSESMSAPTMEN